LFVWLAGSHQTNATTIGLLARYCGLVNAPECFSYKIFTTSTGVAGVKQKQ
jgi:hypothetical protein